MFYLHLTLPDIVLKTIKGLFFFILTVHIHNIQFAGDTQWPFDIKKIQY